MDDLVTCVDIDKYIGVPVFALLILFTLYILQEVAEDYLVPCVQSVSTSYRLRDDVIGAVLLSLCASAAELVVNMISVCLARSSVGTAAIVGSGLFNLLIIYGVVSVYGAGIVITPRVARRELVAYSIQASVAAVVLALGTVHYYSALLLIVCYALYVMLVLRKSSTQAVPLTTVAIAIHNTEQHDVISTVTAATPDTSVVPHHTAGPHSSSASSSGIIQVLCCPVKKLLHITIPKTKPLRGICTALLWMTVAAYVMMFSVVNISCQLGISDTVIGLLIVSIGTSVDDLFEAKAFAKAGHTDMAFSGAIGSNIIDQSIGLGLPWLLGIMLYGPIVVVDSMSLVLSLCVLVVCMLILLLVMHVMKYRLSRKFGFVMWAMYVLWIAAVIVLHL